MSRGAEVGTVLANKGIKLSKPGYLGGGRSIRLGIIESGFAAYAPCSTDIAELVMRSNE